MRINKTHRNVGFRSVEERIKRPTNKGSGQIENPNLTRQNPPLEKHAHRKHHQHEENPEKDDENIL